MERYIVKKKILFSLLISQSTVECFPFPPYLHRDFLLSDNRNSVLKINAGIQVDSLVVLGFENSFRRSLIIESAGDQTGLTIKKVKSGRRTEKNPTLTNQSES